jgi:hypothetical protein
MSLASLRAAAAGRIRTLPERHGRRTLIVLAVIVAVGFGFRAHRAALDPIPHPGVDAQTYGNIARSIYEDQRYGIDPVEASDWSPGAPLLYAATYYATGGEHPGAARMMVALIGTLTILVVYLLARRIAGPAAGLLAAGLLAIYPYFIYDSGRLMSEPLGALGLAAALLAFLWALDVPTPWAFAAPGFLLGVTALARPEYLLFSLVFSAIAFVRPRGLLGWARCGDRGGGRWRFGLASAGVLVAGFLVPVLPWLVRDYVVLDRVVPISTGGGKALYIGTYLPGDGNHFKTKVILYHRFHPKRQVSEDTILRSRMAPLLNRVASRYPDMPRDAALAKLGRQNLRRFALHQPVDFAGMLARKVRRMWSPSGKSMDPLPHVIYHCLLLALGLAGLIVLAVRRRVEAVVLGAVILGITATGALLLAGTRRNVVLMPVVIVLAACAATWAGSLVSSARDADA